MLKQKGAIWSLRAGTKLQRIQKFQGRIAIRENLGFCNPNSRSAMLCFETLGVFAILTQFEAESRRAQNTKVVRLKSKINPEVESRRTVQ